MKNEKISPWLRYIGMTAQLLVLIALAVYGGIKLDAKFGMRPLLTVALPLLALAATFYNIIKETGKKHRNNGSKQTET